MNTEGHCMEKQEDRQRCAINVIILNSKRLGSLHLNVSDIYIYESPAPVINTCSPKAQSTQSFGEENRFNQHWELAWKDVSQHNHDEQL